MIQMPKRSIFPALGAAAALAALSPLAAQAQTPAPAVPTAGAVTLRYKFTPGQVHRYKVISNTTGTMPTGQSGAGIPLNTATQVILKQTVKDVRPSDGAATVVTEIESLRFALNGTEQPMPDAQEEAMKKPLTQVMLPTGKVLSATLSETPGTSLPGMDFSKMFSSLSVPFPDGALKVGDTWKSTISAPGMTEITLTFDTMLMSVTGEGDAARAALTQKISGTLGMKLSQGMPMGMTMAGTLRGTGTMVFNTAAGRIENGINDSTIETVITFKPKPGQAVPPGMPAGMKMQMRQKTTMELLPEVFSAPVK